MEKVKIKHDTYNDGFIQYGTIEIIRNEKMVKTGERIKEIGILPFSKMTIRDNDNIVADSLGYTINEKIKVPYRELPKNIKITINNGKEVFDIVKKDSSDRRNLYLYLQLVTNAKEEYNDWWKNSRSSKKL